MIKLFVTDVINDYIKKSLKREEPVSYTHLDVYKRQLVSFLHYWAIDNFLEAASWLGREDDVKHYTDMRHTCLLYTSRCV